MSDIKTKSSTKDDSSRVCATSHVFSSDIKHGKKTTCKICGKSFRIVELQRIGNKLLPIIETN